MFSHSYMQCNLSFICFLSNFQASPLIKRQHSATSVPKPLNFEKAGWPGSQSITIFSELWKSSFLPRISVFMPLLSKYLIMLNLLLKFLQLFIPLPPPTNAHVHMYMYIYTYTGLLGLIWCRFPVMPSAIFSLTEGKSLSLIFQFTI